MPPTWVTDNGSAAVIATGLSPQRATMTGGATEDSSGENGGSTNGNDTRPSANTTGGAATNVIPAAASTTPGRPASANISPRSLATATRLLSEALEGYTSPARSTAAPPTEAASAANVTARQTAGITGSPAAATTTGNAAANAPVASAPVPAPANTSSVPANRRQTSPPIDAETPPPAYSLVAARPRTVQHTFGNHIASGTNAQRQTIGAAQRQQVAARASVQAAAPFVGHNAQNQQNAVGFDTIPRQAPRMNNAPKKTASLMNAPDGMTAFLRLLPALDTSLVSETDRVQWLQFLFANVEAQDKNVLRAQPQKAVELAAKYAPRVPGLAQAFASHHRMAATGQPGNTGQQRPASRPNNTNNVQTQQATRLPPSTSQPQPLQPVQQGPDASLPIAPAVPMHSVPQQQAPMRPMQQHTTSPQIPSVTADDPIAIRCALAQQQAATHFQQGWDCITVLTDSNNDLLRIREELAAQVRELQQQIAQRDTTIQAERQRAANTQKAAELHAARQGEVARNSLTAQREADMKKIQALEQRIGQLAQSLAEEARKVKGEMDLKQEAFLKDAKEKQQALESRIKDLQSQLQSGHSAEVVDLKEKLQKRTAMMTKLQEEKEQEIAAIHDGYRSEITKSTKKVEELQGSNAKLEAWKENLSSLQRKLKKELDAKTEEHRSSTEKIAKLEQEVEDIMRSNDSSKASEKQAAAEEFAKAMKAMEDHHKAQYEDLSKQLATTTQSKSQEIADLSDRLKEAQASLDKLRDDNVALVNEKAVLELSLNSVKQELAAKRSAESSNVPSLSSASQAEQPHSEPRKAAAKPSWATTSAPAASAAPVNNDRTSRPAKRRAESPLFLSDDTSDRDNVGPIVSKRPKHTARSQAFASQASTPSQSPQLDEAPARTALPAKTTITTTPVKVKIEPMSTPSQVTGASRKPVSVVNTNVNASAVTVDETWMRSRRHKFFTRHGDGKVSCELCLIDKDKKNGHAVRSREAPILPGKPNDEEVDRHIMTVHGRLLQGHRVRRLQQGREPCPPGWLKEA